MLVVNHWNKTNDYSEECYAFKQIYVCNLNYTKYCSSLSDLRISFAQNHTDSILITLHISYFICHLLVQNSFDFQITKVFDYRK